MFNEHYGLETATLNGSKTRTSRILKLPKSFKGFMGYDWMIYDICKYGEIKEK